MLCAFFIITDPVSGPTTPRGKLYFAAGVGVLDFESWRPTYRQNWASLNVYRDKSRALERRLHPLWSKASVDKEVIITNHRKNCYVFVYNVIGMKEKKRKKKNAE